MGTSVSYRLHDAAAPIWEACLKHPFVTGIGDGTLAVCKWSSRPASRAVMPGQSGP